MASTAPEPPSTGVVALDSARRTLSVIIAGESKLTLISKDHATDIPYSTDALLRLTKLLPRSIRTFDNMNQVSQVADHFLLQFFRRNSAYIDVACALYNTIAEDLNRLLIKEEVYLAILAQYGRVLVNNKIRDKRLLKVQGDVESLLEIMLEIEREEEQFSGVVCSSGLDLIADRTNPTSSSSSRHHSQPVWADEQTKISDDELRHQRFNRDNYCQPPLLIAQDPRLMTLVKLRKNGEFVRHALFDKGSESWPNELRDMLSLTGFSF
ncbi:hypothetical protein NEUTE1DRAFT_35794 [Neurospora tetrasperma FGSC 2508]|uniref:Uncharacterized protein n=1 Tax=Neurospora tetrasperma (strain FGSC 2508 / ATCC MYA-4615 / P0657) TaxID=510951 RepID=F8MBT4_NEUT8|nr:uncharacterized protein NEUTE1DRAFT_35794 [Neurospora tetrasperma FGSC 2508]EGO60342.1 hypothetical protein NEUTE1DRAFT_35794 [Neurospora tetrasperma FGSC 2508]